MGKTPEVSAIGLVCTAMSQSCAAEAPSQEERTLLETLAERVGVRGERYNPEHMAFLDR